MVKTLTDGKRRLKQKPSAGGSPATRTFEPDKFEADTQEVRPIALLAERRRQFLARLGAREETDETADG